VPPALLEEVFALNEELDEIRELRESGGDEVTIRTRLEAARTPIEGKRDEHGRRIQELGSRWDSQASAPSDERLVTLQALREQLLESKYIDNLLATIEREAAGSGLSALASVRPEAEGKDVEPRAQDLEPRA